jgi:hypothetical protein
MVGKSTMKKLISILILFSTSTSILYAQEIQDLPERRNIIKVDITSNWLYRNAIVFSYERTTKPNQSFSITAGIQQFPSLKGIDFDSIKVKRESSARGLKLGAEYRFYLKKENKYNAPRGVFIGPYTSFHNYSNGRSLEVNHNGALETVKLNTDLNILNVGVQLGYQFVINNRWAIDLVFIGPSISNYRFKSSLDGNYTFDPDDITNEIVLALIDRFPAFDDLISDGEIVSNGKFNNWSYGYRYQFQIGYHFGRKKK